MLYWIFDLDYTLYDIPKEYPFNYSLINKNMALKNLLKNLPHNKIIFTNGTKGHAIHTCEIIGILDQFYYSNIYGRNETGFKPSIESYLKIIDYNNIKQTDKVIFFEDTIENLVAAKENFNWITVLIGEYINSPYVDFSFSNINQALSFFNNCINKSKA